MFRSGQHALAQLRNRLRLVAGGRVIRNEFKFHTAKVRTNATRVKRSGSAAPLPADTGLQVRELILTRESQQAEARRLSDLQFVSQPDEFRRRTGESLPRFRSEERR